MAQGAGLESDTSNLNRKTLRICHFKSMLWDLAI